VPRLAGQDEQFRLMDAVPEADRLAPEGAPRTSLFESEGETS